MSKPQVKNHKEKLEKNLFSKDYFSESENGNTYPKNRIVVNYLSYSGEYLDRDDVYQEYNGDKVKIIVSKLTQNQNGDVEVKKKALTNRQGKPYVVNDQKDIDISVEEYIEMITNAELDFERIEKKS